MTAKHFGRYWLLVDVFAVDYTATAYLLVSLVNKDFYFGLLKIDRHLYRQVASHTPLF